MYLQFELKELRRKQDEAEEERRRQVEEIARQTEKPDGADRRSETGSIKSGRKYFKKKFFCKKIFPLIENTIATKTNQWGHVWNLQKKLLYNPADLGLALNFTFLVMGRTVGQKIKKSPGQNFKNGQKSIFELGKCLKLPKMQYHEKKILIYLIS